jgi:hypothetical protein
LVARKGGLAAKSKNYVWDLPEVGAPESEQE